MNEHEWNLVYLHIEQKDGSAEEVFWCKRCGTVQRTSKTAGKADVGFPVFYIPGKGSIPNSQQCIEAGIHPELEALREENRLLRNLAQAHELDRDMKEFYERLLTEIGKSIGCGHLDERLPSCVGDIAHERGDALRILESIVRRNGVTPVMVQKIEEHLKELGLGKRSDGS